MEHALLNWLEFCMLVIFTVIILRILFLFRINVRTTYECWGNGMVHIMFVGPMPLNQNVACINTRRLTTQ